MSQVLDHVRADDPVDSDVDDREEQRASVEPSRPVGMQSVAIPGESFDYQPVPVLAPLAAVLATCSVLAWWLLPMLGVALVAVVVGAVAVRKIKSSEGELGGLRLATVSLVLASTMFVASTSRHAYLVATEVPEGFDKINFAHDISAYPIGQKRGRILLAEEVARHVDQSIFVKGYMFPMEKKYGLTSFLLVKDNQLCCFGKQVAPTDMILVELPEGRTFDYTTGMVSVGGTFRVEAASVEDQDNQIVYRLDGRLVEKSKTIF